MGHEKMNQNGEAHLYRSYTGKKVLILSAFFVSLFLLFLVSISVGAVQIPLGDVISVLFSGRMTTLYERIIWNIRIPQALTAIVAGAGLSVAGVCMQSTLRNPLASPYTLGLSNAAAFGAAVGILFFGSGTTGSSIADAVVVNNPYLTTVCAFFFSILTSLIVLVVARLRSATPEVMILAGVAISSLFSAGLMGIQYFVDDTKLASIVFWQFGDVSRASWSELGLITVIVLICTVYILLNRWNYNAIDAGDETARGLGVNVSKTRLLSLVASSVISASVVSFLGVIGFVGLVCPHMVRRLIGDDHRFLIPGSLLAGSLLLLASDTAARMIISPHVLPVAVLTSFLGAPVFLYLIMKRRGMT